MMYSKLLITFMFLVPDYGLSEAQRAQMKIQEQQGFLADLLSEKEDPFLACIRIYGQAEHDRGNTGDSQNQKISLKLKLSLGRDGFHAEPDHNTIAAPYRTLAECIGRTIKGINPGDASFLGSKTEKWQLTLDVLCLSQSIAKPSRAPRPCSISSTLKPQSH